MIIWLHTVQNHGHEVCWHGNSCHGNWYGSYVHADAVRPLTLWRTECRECEKKRLSSTPLTILTIISVIPLLHVSFKCHQHEWLIYHLRVPPCGCPYACVCLTLWACGLCTGAGLDRKPRRSLPQQTHRCGKVPAPSPSSAETARRLWGSGTGNLVLFL